MRIKSLNITSGVMSCFGFWFLWEGWRSSFSRHRLWRLFGFCWGQLWRLLRLSWRLLHLLFRLHFFWFNYRLLGFYCFFKLLLSLKLSKKFQAYFVFLFNNDVFDISTKFYKL
jgi:hypothetical protein